MKKTLVWLLTISLVLACMPAMGMAESLGTIKVWYSGDNEGTRVELFEKAKAEIEAEYPGTTVEIETIAYSELNAKQLTACRAGVGVPDVMSQSATATNGFMVEGLLLPLEDLMADLGRDLKAEFNPAFFSLMEDEEHIYGVPQSKTALVLVYNKTLFEEAGIEEPPTTWDELYECAKKLTLTKEDGTKQYGFAYPGTNAGNIWFRIVPAIWSCRWRNLLRGTARPASWIPRQPVRLCAITPASTLTGWPPKAPWSLTRLPFVRWWLLAQWLCIWTTSVP